MNINARVVLCCAILALALSFFDSCKAEPDSENHKSNYARMAEPQLDSASPPVKLEPVQSPAEGTEGVKDSATGVEANVLRGEVSKNTHFFHPKISEIETKIGGTTAWEVILHGDVKLTPQLIERFRNSAVFSDPGQDPRHIKLYIGNILTDCSEPMTIDLSLARVKISRGAIVYVRASQTGTAILNFHDDHRDSVKVIVGDMQIGIPPGRMLLVTEQKGRSFDELNPCTGVWYRTLFEKQVTEKTRVFQTQFSLMSAANLMPSVKRLATLRKPRGNKMAKTFAAVYQVSRDRHPFRPKLHS